MPVPLHFSLPLSWKIGNDSWRKSSHLATMQINATCKEQQNQEPKEIWTLGFSF
jgi:hypothetical protein